MKKKFSALLTVSLALMLIACDQPPPPVSLPPASASPAPASVVSTPIQPGPGGPAFLTGLEKGPDYPKDKRITAVMINNIAASRPVRGLAGAKIVYEIKTEGGVTRFMALYEDYTAIPEAGSVRSARDQFFQLLLPYWGFYVFEGPNEAEHQVNLMMSQYEYGEFEMQPSTGAVYWIDRPGFTKKEYMAFTDAARLTEAVKNTGASDFYSYGSPIFDFLPPGQPPRTPAASAAEVAVIHSHNYRTLFEYDEKSASYRMSMFSEYSGAVEPTVDEGSGKQVAFGNLMVIFAPMTLYDNSELVKVDYDASGVGYYFTQGRYERIFWSKAAPNHPLLLYQWNSRGEMVKVNPGTSYVAVVDDSQLADFETALLSGSAGSIAGAGGVNSNREDVPG